MEILSNRTEEQQFGSNGERKLLPAGSNTKIGGFEITDKAYSSKDRFNLKAGPYVLRVADWDSIRIFYQDAVKNFKTVEEARQFWSRTGTVSDWNAGFNPNDFDIEFMHFSYEDGEQLFQVRKHSYDEKLREWGFAIETLVENRVHLASHEKDKHDILMFEIGDYKAICENWSQLKNMVNEEKMKEILTGASCSYSVEDKLKSETTFVISLTEAKHRLAYVIADAAYGRCKETLEKALAIQGDIVQICQTEPIILKLIETYRKHWKK